MRPRNYYSYQYLSNNYTHTNNLLTLVFALIWIGYLLLSPFYVFQSGLPQPADLLITIGMVPALLITMVSYRGPISWVYIFGALFTILISTINFIYYNHLDDMSLIRPIFFYIFNFFVFCFCSSLFLKNPIFMNKGTYAAIATVIIMEALYIVLVDNSHRRFIGTFNNPNQLGNWALIMAATLIALKRDKSINLFDLGLLGLGAYIETKALSKSGMISYALLMLMVVFHPHTNQKIRYIIILGLVVVSLLQITAPKEFVSWLVQVDNMNKAVHRIMGIGSEADDSFLVRGYSRLIEYPEYLILGAGEGAYWRFNSSREFHSSLGALTFSYGIFGLFLFLGILYFVFRRVPYYYALLLLPIMAHGLFHQNLRNTMFWVFLAIIYSWHAEKRKLMAMQEASVIENENIKKKE